MSAGDTSGDLHGAAVVTELRRRDPGLEVAALGGRALEAAGAEVLEPIAENPVMGFTSVFASLGYFLRLLSRTERFLERFQPDLVLLIDYPGFNVNLATLAHRHGLTTCYYICPQYWGWAPWRARKFARAVDHALVIFPFETRFLEANGVSTQFVGHPVADRVFEAAREPRPREFVALLPGSRGMEVSRHLPWILEAAERLQQLEGRRLRFAATHPRAAVRSRLIRDATHHGLELEVSDQPLPELLSRSRLSLVSSGTATLEAALLGVPSVVLYRVNRFMLLGSRFLLTSPFIAQPNLLCGHELFPEFLTARSPVEAMARAAHELYREGPRRTQVLSELARLRERVLRPGADRRAAAAIGELLRPAGAAV